MLKEQGRCNEAIPYFVESIRLDRQPKALLNLADCEEKMGRLGVASTHFIEARDLAQSQGLEPQRAMAEQRLQAIDKRLPKLIIRLAPDSPAGTAVTRDGFDLGSISFNSPLPVDVGKHIVVARGGGFQRRFDVSVVEGETKEVVVTPNGGEPIAVIAPSSTAAKAPPPPVSSSTVSVGLGPTSQAAEPSTGNGQRIAGFSLMGVGAVGVAVGTVFGISVSAKNREIDGICPTGQPCPPQQVADYNSAVADAKIARAASLVGFGVGAIMIGTGVVLVLTAPKRASGSAVWLTPAFGSSGAGASLGGTW